MFTDLFIGGFAGIFSRTITAPLELYKIQRQNAFMPNATLRDVIKKEGFRYLWKGHGTNCIRAFPQKAINYGIFSFARDNIFNKIPNDKIKNFLSGSAGGTVAIISTYPLETIRTRLALQSSQSHYTGIYDAFKKIPFVDLYKGLKISIIGFAPFSAINFMLYFSYKEQFEKHSTLNPDINKLICGGLAGVTALSITYPTDLMRRRFQLQNFDPCVPRYSGIRDCVSKIYYQEGLRGLYAGLKAAQIRQFPTVALQFWTMEKLNELLK